MRNQVGILLFMALAYAFTTTALPGSALPKGPIATSADHSTNAPAWEVTGDFSEACECRAPCPCWYGKKPTDNHCHNVQVFKVQKGHYGAVPLGNLVVVVVWVSPPGQFMEESAAHSLLIAMYMDRSASAAQRHAVETIWHRAFFPPGAHALRGGMKAVRFQTANVGPDHAVVVIPGTLDYEIRTGSKQPMNVHVPTFHNLRVARSVHYRYSDYGTRWDYPGRHAAFATFHAESSPSPRQGRAGGADMDF